MRIESIVTGGSLPITKMLILNRLRSAKFESVMLPHSNRIALQLH